MGSYMGVLGVQVAGGADMYIEQKEAFGQRWDIAFEHLYESYEKMLEREQLDIVSVYTSAVPRAKIVLDIACMVREKRTNVRCIWVEKPMTISLEEADAMVDACREAGIILMMNAMRASDVYYRRVRALIDEGALGRMLQVTAHGDGNLSHMGVHWIGVMSVLAGGSERVSWLVSEAESDEKTAGDADFATKMACVDSTACCSAGCLPGLSTQSARREPSTFATATMGLSSSYGGWNTLLRVLKPPQCGIPFLDRNASGAQVWDK